MMAASSSTSVARLMWPRPGTSTGSNSSTVTPPSSPVTETRLIDSAELLESPPIRVPLSGCAATTRVPAASTVPSRSVTPAPTVLTRSVG